jgi:hypothetical protein
MSRVFHKARRTGWINRLNSAYDVIRNQYRVSQTLCLEAARGSDHTRIVAFGENDPRARGARTFFESLEEWIRGVQGFSPFPVQPVVFKPPAIAFTVTSREER